MPKCQNILLLATLHSTAQRSTAQHSAVHNFPQAISNPLPIPSPHALNPPIPYNKEREKRKPDIDIFIPRPRILSPTHYKRQTPPPPLSWLVLSCCIYEIPVCAIPSPQSTPPCPVRVHCTPAPSPSSPPHARLRARVRVRFVLNRVQYVVSGSHSAFFRHQTPRTCRFRIACVCVRAQGPLQGLRVFRVRLEHSRNYKHGWAWTQAWTQARALTRDLRPEPSMETEECILKLRAIY